MHTHRTGVQYLMEIHTSCSTSLLFSNIIKMEILGLHLRHWKKSVVNFEKLVKQNIHNGKILQRNAKYRKE